MKGPNCHKVVQLPFLLAFILNLGQYQHYLWRKKDKLNIYVLNVVDDRLGIIKLPLHHFQGKLPDPIGVKLHH